MFDNSVRDEAWHEQLYKTYREVIMRMLIYTMADRHAAEEVCNDTFFTAWVKRHKVPDDPAKARAWLLKTAKNKSRNQYRSARRHQHAPLEPDAAPLRLAAESADTWIDRDFIDVDRPEGLSDEDFRILLQMKAFGYSDAEVAEAEGITPAAARKRLSRAMKRVLALIKAAKDKDRRRDQ